MTPRTQHIEWAKRRALAYVEAGDLVQALASMGSDMNKRSDTRISGPLAALGMQHAINRDADGMRNWIRGFQ